MTRHRGGSRSSRTNTQGSRRVRRQRRGLDEHEDQHLATYDESSLEDTTSDFVDSSAPEFQNTRDFPHAEDELSSAYTMPDPMEMSDDGTFDHNHSHQLHGMLGEPRQEWPLAYPQPSLPHQAQAWASSATFPLSYGVSQIPTDADSGWAESVPSSTDQYYPSESVSAPQDQTAEMDGAQDEWHRRLSTQAYQGSDSEHPDINYYESVVASPSTSQPVTLGMDNSGDSSGETSPVYRASYVSECMNGEDEPWSTECPRRSGYPHYHPC